MNDILSFSQAKVVIRSELVLSWLNGGSLKIYSGTRPATTDTTITNQLNLCSFTLSNPAGTSVNGLFTASEIPNTLVAETGFASWARIFDSSGVVVADCDVGIINSGALIELNLVNLVVNVYVKVLSFTLIEN